MFNNTLALHWGCPGTSKEMETHTPDMQSYHVITCTAGGRRGRFSLVAMCVNTENNQAYAAKLVEATEQSLEAAVAEYESLRSLRHERIAALFDAYK